MKSLSLLLHLFSNFCNTDSWIFILLIGWESNNIIFYFVNQIVLFSSTSISAPASFGYIPFFLFLFISSSLASGNTGYSKLILYCPCPNLRILPFPRSAGLFNERMEFRNQDQELGMLTAIGMSLLSRPSQQSELGYVYVYECTCTFLFNNNLNNLK